MLHSVSYAYDELNRLITSTNGEDETMARHDETKRDSEHEQRPAHVLVVDTDSTQLESICRGVFLYGHRCTKLRSVSAAIDLLNRPNRGPVDILITDLTHVESDGFRLIRQARELHPNLPIIAVCGLFATEQIEQVRAAGILILRRPFNPTGLDDAIRDMVA